MITSHSAAAAILPPGRVGAGRGGARGRRKGRGFRDGGAGCRERGGVGCREVPRSAAGGRCGAAPLPPPRSWGPRRRPAAPTRVPRRSPARCRPGAVRWADPLRAAPERRSGGMGKSCKVVVCGQAAVGKTAILEQLLYGNHVVGACRAGRGAARFRTPRHPAVRPAGSEMIETQEDIYVGSIETDRGVREQVRFYDTRGLRDGLELPKHCFSCTDGYVLVYSTDSKESFKRVELLKKEIDKCKDKKEVSAAAVLWRGAAVQGGSLP